MDIDDAIRFAADLHLTIPLRIVVARLLKHPIGCDCERCNADNLFLNRLQGIA